MPVTIDKMIEIASEHLPEDWTLKIVVNRGMLKVFLYNPDADMVEPQIGDDATVQEDILARINAARDSDGLKPIDVRGLRLWNSMFGMIEDNPNADFVA